MKQKLLSPKDLAEYLKVPVRTIYVWNHEGTGPGYFKIGKHVRYRRDDVEAWLNERTEGEES